MKHQVYRYNTAPTLGRWGLLTLWLLWGLQSGLQAQAAKVAQQLQGRWELAAYSEQGVQVNKTGAAAAQAAAVYTHVAAQRKLQFWVGYADDYDQATRESRSFRRWAESDSLQETQRLQKIIELPYYVAFFPDSTLSGYNKDFVTGRVSNPEVWRYTLSADGQSIRIQDAHGFSVRWHAQILYLDDMRLVLFLPEDAEVVELKRAEYRFP